MLLHQNLIFRFRFSFVFRNFCVRRGEGRRHGGAARPARPLGPGRALAATNAKIEKRGRKASERPGVRTSEHPDVRASERPSVRTSGRPDVRASERPSVRASERPSVENGVGKYKKCPLVLSIKNKKVFGHKTLFDRKGLEKKSWGSIRVAV